LDEKTAKKIDAVIGLFEEDTYEKKCAAYDDLKKAVKRLLLELRIDNRCLKIMARGFSPEYYEPNGVFRSDCNTPNPKVQLSKFVAEQLIAAGLVGYDMLEIDDLAVSDVYYSAEDKRWIRRKGSYFPQ
jgi:hypothetical protein